MIQNIAFFFVGLCAGFFIVVSVFSDDMALLKSTSKVCIAAKMTVEECLATQEENNG